MSVNRFPVAAILLGVLGLGGCAASGEGSEKAKIRQKWTNDVSAYTADLRAQQDVVDRLQRELKELKSSLGDPPDSTKAAQVVKLQASLDREERVLHDIKLSADDRTDRAREASEMQGTKKLDSRNNR